MTKFESDDYRVDETPDGKGRGLYASRAFAVGDYINRLDYWSLDLMPIHITNHSCDPNGRYENGVLVAVRPIAKDEEITFDYLVTPTPASPWDFKCECSAANCVGWIRAA